jgi:hypothetical protein
MLKTTALIGLGAAIALTPAVAVAQTGYGVTPGQPSSTPFDRSFNHFNQSKAYARQGARWLREHNYAPSYSGHHDYYYNH